MLLWKFKTKNFIVTVKTTDEPFVHDSYMDADLCRECREKIRSGEWKCFYVTWEVTHRLTGKVLAEEFLSQCIYANRKDFVDHRGMNGKGYGSYFSQGVREVCAQARNEMRRLRNEIGAGVVRAV